MPTDSITLRLYGPDPATGLVTYFEQTKTTLAATNAMFFKAKADDTNGTTISTAGARVLRASLTYAPGGTPTTIFSNVLPVVVPPPHGRHVYTLTINN